VAVEACDRQRKYCNPPLPGIIEHTRRSHVSSSSAPRSIVAATRHSQRPHRRLSRWPGGDRVFAGIPAAWTDFHFRSGADRAPSGHGETCGVSDARPCRTHRSAADRARVFIAGAGEQRPAWNGPSGNIGPRGRENLGPSCRRRNASAVKRGFPGRTYSATSQRHHQMPAALVVGVFVRVRRRRHRQKSRGIRRTSMVTSGSGSRRSLRVSRVWWARRFASAVTGFAGKNRNSGAWIAMRTFDGPPGDPGHRYSR